MTESFDFWKDHSTEYLEMAFDASHREKIENPDACGTQARGCGDTVTFYLMIHHNRIMSVSFDLDGCLNTNACANTLARMAKGLNIAEAWEISPGDVIAYLKTLPQHEHHCAELAVGAFHQALANYREIQNSPWKKAYQNRV